MALIDILRPEDDPRERDESPSLRTLRVRITFGIVVVSILSAVAVWRASVYDERAAHSDALFRQQLVLQQQLERADEDNVTAEVTYFGDYERHALLARLLLQDAAAHPPLRPQLKQQAAREQTLAAAQLSGFSYVYPQTRRSGRVSYKPSSAYQSARDQDTEFERFQPGEHRQEATDQHLRGVNLTGVAAAFIAALVLMTLAQVSLGTGEKTSESRLGIARLLAGSGFALALCGAILFVVVIG